MEGAKGYFLLKTAIHTPCVFFPEFHLVSPLALLFLTSPVGFPTSFPQSSYSYSSQTFGKQFSILSQTQMTISCRVLPPLISSYPSIASFLCFILSPF